MNRAEAYEYAKAQSQARAQGLPTVDPHTFMMNNHNKARLANASVAANSAKPTTNQNVRPNPPSDVNQQNTRAKPDILPSQPSQALLRNASEAPHPPIWEGRSPSDGEGEPQNSQAPIRGGSDIPQVAEGVTPIQRKAVISLLKGTSITD